MFSRINIEVRVINKHQYWLEEQLVSGTESITKEFDGFDISPVQFPKNGDCNVLLQDTLQPFPSHYHGKYDLVHIRYMIIAFTKDQFLTAANNLMQILSE